MVVAGNVGIGINCQSFCNSFRLCVTADEGILSRDQVNTLCHLIEDCIRTEMERTKDWPLADELNKK
jgi:hypothetical protein